MMTLGALETYKLVNGWKLLTEVELVTLLLNLNNLERTRLRFSIDGIMQDAGGSSPHIDHVYALLTKIEDQQHREEPEPIPEYRTPRKDRSLRLALALR